jgi:SAM-dependent methyltransferase
VRGNAYPSSSRLCDRASRRRKAAKIVTVLRDVLGEGRSRARCCLDVGCFTGLITEHLGRHFQTTVGLDPDTAAIAHAQGENSRKRVTYLVGDAAHLPFLTESFDVLVCAQVYEHVADQDALFSELWRVLRPDGVCFFSGPNRLAVMEEHYHLPFLSWLPRQLADWYMRAAGRGSGYHETPLTYWQLRRRLRRFAVHDYTVEMVKAPERFSCSDEIRGWIRTWLQWVPKAVLKHAEFLLPNYNWVLIKRRDRQPDPIVHYGK